MIYDVSYKSFIVAKPFSIIFDKVDSFIKDCGGTKYLVLQGSETFDAIFERIRYLIGLKSGISYVYESGIFSQLLTNQE